MRTFELKLRICILNPKPWVSLNRKIKNEKLKIQFYKNGRVVILLTEVK